MSRYKLPRSLYKKTIWTIKDYDRLKQQREAILSASVPPPDGQPKGNGSGDGVVRAAIKLADIDMQISAIDKALEKIPPEYRKGVWEYIQTSTPFPVDASLDTYKRWKQRFVFYAASFMGWL